MEKYEYDIMRKIRKLYFTHYSQVDIAKKLNLGRPYVVKIIKNRNFIAKKERYYRFLIEHAYCNNMSISDVAKIAGVKNRVLTSIKRKYKIVTKRFVWNKKINDEIKKQIIDYYEKGFSCGEIAKKFNFKTSKTVEDVLEKNGVSRRLPRETKRYDYNYFSLIDSHEKAYILGLLYTDGYIYKDYKGLCIQLTESDGYLLEKIAKKIGPAVSIIKINCDTKRKTTPNAKDMVRLGIYSKTLSEQVKNLGVVKRKTYDMEIPLDLIKEEFRYSLLRGIVDGDGTIGIAKTGNIWFKIATKSERFANSICSLVSDNFSVYKFKNKYGDMFSVILKGGNASTINCLKKMYADKNDLYLLRKYDRIKSLI